MEKMWFTTNIYESLGDIYTKYCFLDLTNEDVIDLIDNACIDYLSSILLNKGDLRYFSYDLKYDKSGDKITILPDNILCALWFIGEFPPFTQKVLKENHFENKNFIYTFDENSCKLKKIKK